MSSEAPDLVAALRLAKRLIDEALPCFDWGASPLTADAIRLLNDVPPAVEAALASIAGTVDSLPAPRPRGPLCAADADALRLDLNAGSLLILASDGKGRFSAVLTARAAEADVLGHDEAYRLWTAVTAVLRTLPAVNPVQPEQAL